MIRPQADVSAHVYRDDKTVVMRLNRDNYRLTKREAVMLADELVDAAEQSADTNSGPAPSGPPAPKERHQ
ncbi:hypothetical protein [uncultured Dietzia sp.]|uniref:hypothetical protein n=1 Tax=uncultured Dietzia sp. TaxID=395519 RepID=UPI0030FBC5DF